MMKEENTGGRPINPRRTWNEDQRQKKKELQKKNWFKSGGFDVPLFVPHTPNGELAKRMRKAEAQNHQGRRIRFKIVEKGGVTLESLLRRSNPWSEENCGRDDCFSLQRREGWDLLERGGHLHPRLPKVWRRDGSLLWRNRTKWLLKRKGAF